MSKFISYLKATKEELKEVTFPSVSLTITYSIIVILMSIVIALVLGGVDLSLKELLTKLVGR